jgi:3-oxo-5alpha-steroid 4-dehydrogenase
MPEVVRPSSSVKKWDRETDVLVVGLGCAGACAAFEAVAAGVRVLALE